MSHVKCTQCQQPMDATAGATCTGNSKVTYPDGSSLPSVPHDDRNHCHDCNVAPGGAHHPGCDMERCPKCKGQLISCGCLDEDADE